ncbi:MAG: CDP-alcohol phosphatidyltransferase family protein [Acidobacteria bacterium]|nr:CDP-alcohol phosphatidyltransferase family protein [Acidobacteriota bacterium]
MYSLALPQPSPATTLSDDVEELADRRIHRPLARPLVAMLSATAITPNQVTALSGASGVLAAAAIASSGPWPSLRLLAAALLLASAVFDCADGQLARVRGRSSVEGGVLDGISDELVGFAVILASSFVLASSYGPLAWVAGAAAMLSSSVQCLMFDAAKERYVAEFGVLHASSKLAMADRGIDVRPAAPRRAWLQRLFRAYVGRLRRLGARLPARGATDAETARRRIRSWTTLGLGTHMCYGYVAIACSWIWLPALHACLLVFALPMNVQLAWYLHRDRRPPRREAA